MTWVIDRWLQLEELAGLFGLSEETINRVAQSPGVLTSEMLRWLKASAARTADLCKAGKLLVNLFTEPSLASKINAIGSAPWSRYTIPAIAN